MDIITSNSNGNIKLLRKLYDKKFRKEYKMFPAEGITLLSSIPDKSLVEALYIKESVIEKTSELIKGYNCPVYLVQDGVFDNAVETVTPSGVAALIKISEEELKPPKGNALILDRICDPGNLGTIIRTAAASGYEDIYLINSADPYSGKAVRSSMGGIFNVRLYDKEIEDIKGLFINSEIVALDIKGENIFDYKVKDKKYAIIVGNEAHGVSEELIKTADSVLRIPMKSTVESLNAAVAAGITMYMLGRIR